MIRAGLITFHFAHHYGAQLQAYATMRAIQSLGKECEIIDFRLPHTTRTNRLFKAAPSPRALAADAHTALHYPAFQARFQRFEAFVNTQMRLSSQHYTSFAQLQANPPAYDVYVAGSDQIWNPFIYADRQFERAFLLDFVQEGRKISYAPSLGTPTLPPPYDAQLKASLASFDALSVREEKGRDLIRTAAGQEARVVLDPTLLLTGADWGELAVAPKYQTPYILCYFVSDPGEAVPYAQALSQRTGWPIVQLAGARRKIPGAQELVFDAGPREFLGLFQHAGAVVTNSFHGAVFSLQFSRPFFTSMSPKEKANPTASRIYSLLRRLGCAGRVVGLPGTAELDAPMDYSAVQQRLSEARADALAYLDAALEGRPIPAEQLTPPAAVKEPHLCSPAACTGCAACAQICPVGAITMEEDHEGFLRPVVQENCILCRKCEGICPQLAPGPRQGPAAGAQALWALDDTVRAASTSGGAFSLLARQVLDQGGAVFGAVLEEGRTARHVCTRTWEQVAPMRGSKYVQSAIGDTFRQAKTLLDQGVHVLFTGTACQIDGLNRYLGRSYDHLLTCDLVCHGIPSPAVLRGFVAETERREKKRITALSFRDKSHGWGKAHLTLTFADGTQHSAPLYETTFGRGFGMGIFLRPCCAQCPYTDVQRPADLTLGDFWGLDAKLELPTRREDGISLVLANSPKGRAALRMLEDGAKQIQRPLAEAVAGNPRLASPSAPSPKRAAFFAALRTQGYAAAERQFLTPPPLPYRAAAKVLTPGMKDVLRKILK